MSFIDFLMDPWPWYVAGPLIGLTVPLLLIFGNKAFGISKSFKHICAAVLPLNLNFFKYDWKAETWNLLFVVGVLFGAFLASRYLYSGEPVQISDATLRDLRELNLTDFNGLVPAEIFSWDQLLTTRGFIFMVVGGFLVGFGTRYAGGCTSGHSITGLANLQWPSLVATVGFFIGGLITTYLLLPLL